MAIQISFPIGLVAHVSEWTDCVPGVNAPAWTLPGRTRKVLYPADMVRRGYVWITPEEASRLSVGDAIQIDRTHCTIEAVGRPTEVETPYDGKIAACRIRLAAERNFV